MSLPFQREVCPCVLSAEPSGSGVGSLPPWDLHASGCFFAHIPTPSQALPGTELPCRLCLPLHLRQSLQAVRSQAEPGNERARTTGFPIDSCLISSTIRR